MSVRVTKVFMGLWLLPAGAAVSKIVQISYHVDKQPLATYPMISSCKLAISFPTSRISSHSIKSIQSESSILITSYMTEAINSEDASTLTRTGNVKMPNYLLVSEWIKDWADKQTKEGIANSFTVCGLVPVEDYKLEKLHKPLRDCFTEGLSFEEWEEQNNSQVVNNPDNFDEESGSYVFFDEAHSFMKASYTALSEKEDYDFWRITNMELIKKHIISDAMLNSLYTDEERKLLDDGKPTSSRVEIVAASKVLKITINITELDKDCNKVEHTEYVSDEEEKTLDLFLFEGSFGVELTEED